MVQSPNPEISKSENTPLSSQAPLDRRLAISREAQSQILELYAGGIETRSLAERFGVQENYIRKLASRHGVRKGRCMFTVPPQQKKSKPRIFNTHIAAYKAARRGFSVPPKLETTYTLLLIRGYSRREAAIHLGLLKPRRNEHGLSVIASGTETRPIPECGNKKGQVAKQAGTETAPR